MRSMLNKADMEARHRYCKQIDGMVNDIFIGNMNDDCEYAVTGGQEEMDVF